MWVAVVQLLVVIVLCCKQLFDVDNHVNRHAVSYIFNTEGHLFPVSALRRPATSDEQTSSDEQTTSDRHSQRQSVEKTTATENEARHDETNVVFTLPRLYNFTSNVSHLYSLMIVAFIVQCWKWTASETENFVKCMSRCLCQAHTCTKSGFLLPFGNWYFLGLLMIKKSLIVNFVILTIN